MLPVDAFGPTPNLNLVSEGCFRHLEEIRISSNFIKRDRVGCVLNEQTYLPTFMVRTGNEILVDPHVLVIAAGPLNNADYLEAKNNNKNFMQQLIDDVFIVHRDSFSKLDFVSGPTFYRGWTVDVLSPQEWRNIIADGAAVRPVFSGRFKSSIVFPAQLWPAAPNPRGRPNASVHPIEGPIRAAAFAHVYLMHRYHCGWLGRGGRYGKEVRNKASDLLADLLQPSIELAELDIPKVPREDINVARREQLVKVSNESGPSFLCHLYANKDPKFAGLEMARQGSRDAVEFDNLEIATSWIQLKREWTTLVTAWRRAKDVRKAQENARRDMKLGQLTIDEALPVVGMGLSDLHQLGGVRVTDGSVSLQDMAALAWRYEIDITWAFPKFAWARPISLAFAASGALSRRGLRPDVQTLEGCMIAHATASYASRQGIEVANQLGFAADWPQTEFQALADMIGRSPPRHPAILAGTA
jgi:hypothetical protein